MSQNVVTVSALVRYLKSRLEHDAMIQGVLVEGEISNFSSYRSGHWYFSLKDSGAQIRCVMFASSNRTVSFSPKDGDKVTVRGDISVFESRGELQLLVTGMKPSGIGDLFLQFEQLKKKLAEEGLFDEAHKKPIPAYPFKICLITGKNTAARADVLNTVSRRWPPAQIYEFPVLVQGKESASQIIKALNDADGMGFDVILLVRGGGSIEDLWSFNDEQLARTIYALKTPIITGVGHEVDFTIVDFVSDLRAPTPTGAAERATPDIQEVQSRLINSRIRLNNAMKKIMTDAGHRLQTDADRAIFRNPEKLYSEQQLHLNALSIQLEHVLQTRTRQLHQKLDQTKNQLLNDAGVLTKTQQMRLSQNQLKLINETRNCLNASEAQLGKDAGMLDAYSPLKVLQRGYSVVMKNGRAVKSTEQLQEQDSVHVLLGNGSFEGSVTKVNQGE